MRWSWIVVNIVFKTIFAILKLFNLIYVGEKLAMLQLQLLKPAERRQLLKSVV